MVVIVVVIVVIIVRQSLSKGVVCNGGGGIGPSLLIRADTHITQKWVGRLSGEIA